MNYEKGPILIKSGPFLGGDKRDRTADLLNAIQALSQLSYTPTLLGRYSILGTIHSGWKWGAVYRIAGAPS